MQNYSLLIFSKINTYSKFVFPIHEGENIIGTSKESDICLEIGEDDLNIEPIHAKILLNRQNYLLDVGIKVLKSNKAYIKKEENKKLLVPGNEYELSKNCIFFLNDNMKFQLIKGTIDEIKIILFNNNLENEFWKWYKNINNGEKENKINFNLDGKYISNLKNESRKLCNTFNDYSITTNNYEISKNKYFSFKSKQNNSNKYKTESFSTTLSSNNFKTNNKKISNGMNCKRNLLNIFNINLDEEKIENIYKEKNDIIRILLDENGLDDIINSTNFKRIKKYDKLYYSFLFRKTK